MSGPWTNQAIDLIVLTEQTTGFSGIFGYSPTVGAGNLIFSLSAAAGTDPYGNAYPQGLNLGTGAITGIDFVVDGANGAIFIYSGTPGSGNLIGSWAGMAGTDAYGNAYPQGINVTTGTISGTTITAGNTIINSNGVFTYSSTPAAGNLIVSQSGAAGADGFGNNYLAGTANYSATTATQLDSGFIIFYGGSLAGGWSQLATQEFTGAGVVLLSGGLETVDNTLDDGSGNMNVAGDLIVMGNVDASGTSCKLSGGASSTVPATAPSRTALGATWNAGTASDCNQNFVNIINALGGVGIFT